MVDLMSTAASTHRLAGLSPNWFATAMGTGIIAVAASSLPWQSRALHVSSVLVWVLAAALLVTLLVTAARTWAHDGGAARRHLLDPAMAPFFGAAPMALLTVGAGTLLLGRDVIGLRLALEIDWTLWLAGTVTGLLAAAIVPYLMITRHENRVDSAFGGWLMPVVPPMVSASTGALLIPHTPAGPLRVSMLIAGYAMFGLSLIASAAVIRLICIRLVRHGVGEARTVPTLWIVLGPLGQSITAVNLLGGAAHEALPARGAHALRAFGVGYGVPVWCLAMVWLLVAAAITVRTAGEGLPFAMTWWSFTFPVGTCVTATSALALHTGADLFRIGAVVLFVALVGAWLTVSVRTIHGVVVGGLLVSAPAAAGRTTSPRRPQLMPGS
jgi:C4-dicarboxylate transporter/malic acid transport protein